MANVNIHCGEIKHFYQGYYNPQVEASLKGLKRYVYFARFKMSPLSSSLLYAKFPTLLQIHYMTVKINFHQFSLK